jgi:hypothetical protein
MLMTRMETVPSTKANSLSLVWVVGSNTDGVREKVGKTKEKILKATRRDERDKSSPLFCFVI